MPVAGIVTLIGVGLLVAVLAIYLITVAGLLARVSSMLNTIIDRLWGISNSAEPLGGAIGEINRDLAATRQSLDQLLQQKTRQQQAPGGASAKPASAERARRGSARRSPGRGAVQQ